MKDDAVIIHGAVFRCHIGVGEAERAKLQPVVLDARLAFDIRPSAASGKLSDTIDYHDVHAAVREFLEGRPFVLLETLAEDVAGLLLSRFPADTVTVLVKKPQALDLGAPDAWPGIEITRSR
jgi:dihydroneopterin aldolase